MFYGRVNIKPKFTLSRVISLCNNYSLLNRLLYRDAILRTFIENEMINHFFFTKRKELVNIDNGLRATEQISSDILKLENKMKSSNSKVCGGQHIYQGQFENIMRHKTHTNLTN